MRTSAPVFASVALAATLVCAQHAHGAPYAMLNKVVQATHSLRMQGRRTVELKVNDQVRRYEEIVLRAGDKSRIEVAPGSAYAGQIVIEDGKQRLQLNPKSKVVRVLPPQNDAGLQRLMRALKGGPKVRLRVEESDGGDVAGFGTRCVTVLGPRGAVLQRAWIDSKHGAILKREVFNAKGARVAFFEFTEVRFNPKIPKGAFKLDQPGLKFTTPEDQLKKLERKLDLPHFHLSSASGYRLANVRALPAASAKVIMQSYVSGERRVSLFTVSGSVDLARLRKVAGANLHVVTWTAHGVTLVLMGGIPEEDLQLLSRRLGG